MSWCPRRTEWAIAAAALRDRPSATVLGRFQESADALKRAVQVALQVVHVLDAHRQPHERVANAESLALFGRNRRMRHDGRVLDQALDPAQAFGQREQLAGL